MTDSEIAQLGSLIRNARLDKGFSETELARRSCTSVGSIVSAEENALNVSWSTLEKIVETGLGGELDLAIRL